MRVPNMTTYSNATFHLGNLTKRLNDANEVMNTQKRINSISDDPIGLSQVISLKSSIGNLEQIDKNVNMGKSWLSGVETTLSSVNNLVLEVKGQVSRLVSTSASADERKDATASINSMIEQIVTLANTQINGNYIFGGTTTNSPPFVYNTSEDPPSISYMGNNDPFKIKTDNNVTVEVGRDGSKTFQDSTVEINSTNNTVVFKEDNGHGPASEKMINAVVPDGEYSAESLGRALRNVLNKASAESGYGVNYLVDYDADKKSYAIRADGTYSGFIQTSFLWETGGDAYVDKFKTGGTIDSEDLSISVLNKKALTLATQEPVGSGPFKAVWDGNENWIIKNNPGYIIPSKIPGTSYGFELDLDETGISDISVKLAKPALQKGDTIEFDIVPAKGDRSLGHEIGFYGNNVISTTPVSDRRSEYITDITITPGMNDTIDFVEIRPSSLIAAGTVLDADYEIVSNTVVSSGTFAAGSTLSSGSVIVTGTTLGAGTVIGSGIALIPTITLGRGVSGISSGTLMAGSSLGPGTVLGSGTVLGLGTTLGSGSVIGSGTTLTANVTLKNSVSGVSAGLLTTGSSLPSGTILGAGTVLNAGTTIGSGTVLTGDFKVATDLTASHGGVLTAGSFVPAGSILMSGTVLANGESISLFASGVTGTVLGDGASTLAQLATASPLLGAADSYTVVSGGDTLNQGILTLASGSILAFATASGILSSGSSFTGVSVTISSGATLNAGMTLAGANLVLLGNTTLTAGTALAAGSILQSGSLVTDQALTTADSVITLNGAMTLKGITTLNGDSANNVLVNNTTLVAGTTLSAGSTLSSGSIVADQAVTTAGDITLTSDMNVIGTRGVVLGSDMIVALGTILAEGSMLESGSSVNKSLPIDASQIIAAGTVFTANYGIASDIVVGSGVLASGTRFEAGSTIPAGSLLGAGTVIGAGTTLTSDVQVATDITVINSGTLTLGSFVPSGSTLAAGTVLAAGESILLGAGGVSGTITGNGVTTLSALASGSIGLAESYTVTSGDTLSHGITTLSSGSILAFAGASGIIASGSLLTGSDITISSGTTLIGSMNVAGEGVELGGADMVIVAGTSLTAGSIIGKNSTLDTLAAIGGKSAELTAKISAGNYKDMDALGREIEKQLEKKSANNVDYSVSYDAETSRFNIRENGSTLDGLDLLWKTGSHSSSSAGSALGFYVIDDHVTYPATQNGPIHGSITIDATNNILDFEEIDGAGLSSGTLKAFISHGTYTNMADLTAKIEESMNNNSINSATYDVDYDNTLDPPRFTIKQSGGTALGELRLFNNSDIDSIGNLLGFDSEKTGYVLYDSDRAPVLMKLSSDNNRIDFRETGSDGTISDEIQVQLPTGNYTDLNDLASDIQKALRSSSPNKVAYEVGYEYGTGKFMIKGSDADITSFSLLWKTGDNASKSSAKMLGFDPEKDDVVTFSESDKDLVNINIDASNNKIDFQEITDKSGGRQASDLTASIPPGNYTDHSVLASAIEKALEKESLEKGNRINYSATFDSYTKKFTIKESGTDLDEFRLLWGTGENRPVLEGGTGKSIGSVIGFDSVDDVDSPSESSHPVEWGIFNTLIDSLSYLKKNDVDGLQRTMGRLEVNFDKITSRIADTGIKYKRLEIRQALTSEVKFSLKQRRSSIEDADLIEAIMNLKAIQTAYEASLSSTAKLLKVSLVDYL